MNKRKSRDAVEILYHRSLQNNPERAARVEARLEQMEISHWVQLLRKEAGLSQKELAERVGTTQSVISRLEDAEYSGHSLEMLQRIAEALGRRIELRCVDRFTGARPEPESPMTPAPDVEAPAGVAAG
jgi:ribosome-binding protein aMBF1 (putative translation factor)